MEKKKEETTTKHKKEKKRTKQKETQITINKKKEIGTFRFLLSQVTYNALISACEKGKQPERALELFEAMQRQVVVPDVMPESTLGYLEV